MTLFLKYFTRALMLFLVLPLVNSARGLVAKWQGDDTSEIEGRITLNPMVHLDLLGSLAIMLCGFGWSKPMPINPGRFNDVKKGIILVSLTGPVTHFLSAILCMNIRMIIFRIGSGIVGYSISYIFRVLASINVCLGVINILPLPGMDGFSVLYQFAGPKFHNWYHYNIRTINQVSLIILFVLFFIGNLTNGLIDPLRWIINPVYKLLNLTTFWIPVVFG